MTYRYADLSDYNWLMEQVLLHETDQAIALGNLLMVKLSPESVIDIGCGPGIYLTPFKQAGRIVYGIDGAPAGGESIDPAEFELVDLRNPWTPPRQYDLALCIEVGEHLMPEHTDGLIDTVCKCAPVIFWSAASPGQGGEGHYSEFPQSWWDEKFSRHGFFQDVEMTAQLHSAIDIDVAFEHCGWLRRHSFLLRKR